MAKKNDAAAADKKNKPVETTEFVMTDKDNKKLKIHAPDDSLDKDGHAESALGGVYRTA